MKAPSAIAVTLLALSGCGAPTPAQGAMKGIQGDALPPPLSAETPSPEAGARVFTDRDQGHCVLCHQLTSLDAAFQGNLGPALDGVGSRLSEGQIRLRIAAPHLIWPDTVMPAYARTLGLRQVDPNYEGQAILTGRQIEDLVAFLVAQTEETQRDDSAE